MKLNASNYIISKYFYVEPPHIDFDINSTSTEILKNNSDGLIVNYNRNVSNYIETIESAFEIRDYTMNMLEKDMCAELQFSTIDKINNTYLANIKADNYFQYAKNNYDLTIDNENEINNIYNRLS